MVHEPGSHNPGDGADNTYVYGLDLISVTDRTGAQTYFLYDGLGSTTKMTNGSGTTTGTYSYDVFGGIRSQSGTAAIGNDWRFTGEQRDSQSNRNFYYLRARYYDPASGRFLSQDPLPTGNLYAYVANNPLRYVDPYGLDVCSTVSGIFGKKKDCGEVVDEGEKIVDDASGRALDYVTDPYNIATGVQFVSGAVAGIACPLAETGIGAIVCAEAISVYIGAIGSKTYIVCRDIQEGKITPEQGYAKWVVAFTPLPKGPAGWVAGKVIQPIIERSVDAEPCLGFERNNGDGDKESR